MHHPRTLSLAFAALLAAGVLATPAASGQVRRAQQPAVPPAAREVVTPSGVRYIDLKTGSGDEAACGKVVEVHYTGWLEDGTKFESSRDRDKPFTFRLGAGDVIKGWDDGLGGMRVGGKRKLVVPAELGFGKQGAGGVVPPNSILHYEFELLAVR